MINEISSVGVSDTPTLNKQEKEIVLALLKEKLGTYKVGKIICKEVDRITINIMIEIYENLIEKINND